MVTFQHPSFFIFGPERSGTTLLAFLLSGQPGVFTLNDSFVFDRYVEWSLLRTGKGAPSKYARLSRLGLALAPYARPMSFRDLTTRRLYYSARARFALQLDSHTAPTVEEVNEYNQVLQARYLHSLGADRPSFLNEYVSGIPQPQEYENLTQLFSATITSISGLFAKSAIEALGEKSPLHTPYFEWIRRLYPKAKMIVVVREPVANVASIYKRYGDFKRAVGAYDMYAEAILKISEQPNVLIVRHEDVTKSTAQTLRQILAFLGDGLRFDDSCRVNAYTKTAYTGNVVDQKRSGATPSTLRDDQAELLRKRFHHVRTRFYPAKRAH